VRYLSGQLGLNPAVAGSQGFPLQQNDVLSNAPDVYSEWLSPKVAVKASGNSLRHYNTFQSSPRVSNLFLKSQHAIPSSLPKVGEEVRILIPPPNEHIQWIKAHI
jgi:hypothetical protein